MSLNCGIIGLPNVGKSTIFNALSCAGAQTANYPFCTIEPNKGIVQIPDERLKKISEILKKESPIPARIEFIDVAGLVKGASKGEGLGNKFLGHIRNVDALIHVVRCFDDSDVAHISGVINPVSDIEIINTELILSDIELLERAKDKTVKLARSGDKAAKKKTEAIEKCIKTLNAETLLIKADIPIEELNEIKEYGLITLKPVLYLANTGEGGGAGDTAETVRDYADKTGARFLSLAGKLEEEIAALPEEEKPEYMRAMGIDESGLDRLINAACSLLNLITYYTPATDLQAWNIKEGTKAAAAAGKIHTDFERGFIRAEVFTFNELASAGSEHKIKETGRVRSEGKDYIIRDGDIVRYLFNV